MNWVNILGLSISVFGFGLHLASALRGKKESSWHTAIAYFSIVNLWVIIMLHEW